ARGWWSRAVTGWRLPSIRPVNVLAFAVRCALIVGIMTLVVTAPTWMRDLEVKTARLGETPPPPRVTRIGLNRTLTGHRAGVTQVVPLLSGVATNAASTLGFASADTRGNLLIWRIEARRSPTGKADARYGFDIAQPVQLGTVADPVTSMAANRLSIATGSKGGVVQLWDAAGERKVRTLADGASSVTALAFMGSSRSLAAGYEDGRGQVINTRRGRRRTMGRDSDAIAALTWSPLRKQLISGGTDGAVRLWRKSSTSKVARTFYSHTTDVTALSVSSDGRVLATGGKDQQLKLWDPTEASTAPVLGGHDGPITALALSPDARLLASAGTDAKIKLWDVTERRVIQELVGSTGAVRALAFVRGGDQLISAGDDQRVRVWNTTIVGAVPVPPTADAAGGTGLRTDRLVEGENFTLRTRVSQGPALDEDVSAPVITLRDLTAE
ncbi:MAG: WD40 repeat domain-containing protein, partial [Pseudomonadota bacterium]